MQVFTLDLWEGFQYSGSQDGGFRPTLDVYLLKDAPGIPAAVRPSVLILPGSGYRQCSLREAETLAVRFNAEGYHAFVLWYSCAPNRHPVPILDCARALTVIREHGGEWHLNPEKIAIMGFSAGGHLALSTLLFADRDFAAAPGVNPAHVQADALILCYPVVSSGEFAHHDSFTRLLGGKNESALLELLSLEKHINGNLPPVFIWHTCADQSVPVENSLLLAAALRRAGVPMELHIFPEGKHGLSLAIPETCAGDNGFINSHVAQWFQLCVNWLKLRF
ncbi:acetylesterase [Spirochaetia bacterium]|nr:acetylesterase [Spirochaetia bacterium]